MTSQLRVDRISPATGSEIIIDGLEIPEPTDPLDFQQVKAWIRFNGTGTVSIIASKNVSSLIDNGTGTYTVNYINPMPDNQYVAVCSAEVSTGRMISFAKDLNTGSAGVKCLADGDTRDTNNINVAVIGENL